MIVLKLRGSLGNQLFSYCFGRRMAIEKKDVLILDKWPIYQYRAQSYYSLNKFKIKGIILPFESKYLTSFLRRLDNKNLKIVSRVNFLKIYEPKIILDCLKTKNIVLDGHWQSYKYFQDYWDILKKEIDLKGSRFLPEQKELLKAIGEPDSVSIHIRRGDYIQSKDLDTLPLRYYNKAIEIIRKKVDNPRFFVFSDDAKWVRKNLKLDNAVYPTQNILYPENDLIMMSKAKHNIIANSTFSWWAGYLNENKNKIIIAPNNWFASRKRNSNISDLLPKEWIKI